MTNAINRGLEHPDKPEDVVSLILQGVSARYDCCSAPTEHDTSHRLTEVDFKHFGRAVSHIDMILTKSLSRFARNTVDCLDTVRVLKANGIGVIFEKENINTLTESSEFLI